MKDLYTRFIADYLDKDTRHTAQWNLLKGIELHRSSMEQIEVEAVVTNALTFVEKYRNALPWNRKTVIAQSLRSFN